MFQMNIFQASVLLSLSYVQVLASYSFDPESYDPQDVITTDVAVIGGGSAGVYSAVRLQDYNKGIVIIERNDYLGGHAETYVDPQSGVPINLGVVVFPKTQIAQDYFARFNVSLIPSDFSSPSSTYVDFSTGNSVNHTAQAPADIGSAFQGYAAQLQKYQALQAGFNLTYPVPAELLLPYGEFLNKYNLSALIPSAFLVNQGYSPFLNITTLYMLKYFNVNTLNGFTQGELTTASHNTGELYSKILTSLGPKALLNSSVVAMDRSSPSNVKLVVQTNKTSYKLILAKKLLSTPPPKIEKLSGYDLSPEETDLFSQFFNNGYYSGVLNNTGLPINTTYFNADPTQPYEIPRLPGIYAMLPPGASNLLQVFYGSPDPLPVEDVKADIIAQIKRLAATQGVNGSNTIEPSFVAFTAHVPFNLMVSNEAIANGFYERLYALNGQRNTFYNGAAWQAQDSNAIWEYTESYVLPILLASL